MSNMKLTSSPSALPGSCYFCASASRDVYVDTDRSIEFHGAVYICNLCIHEMAQLLGMLTADQAQTLHQQNEHLIEVNYQQNLVIDGLRKLCDGYADLDDLVGSFAASNRGAALSAVKDSEPLEGSTGDLAEGEGVSSESSDEQGVGDIPDAGNVKPLKLTL